MKKVFFKFYLDVPVPFTTNGEVCATVIGQCDTDEVSSGTCSWLNPVNIDAFFCVNPITDTPLSAWQKIETSDLDIDRQKNRTFYHDLECFVNGPEMDLTDYDKIVISYFTKTVTIEKTTTYSEI